jgi:hypothetical protein
MVVLFLDERLDRTAVRNYIPVVRTGQAVMLYNPGEVHGVPGMSVTPPS